MDSLLVRLSKISVCLLIAGALQFAPTAKSQANVQGQWQTLSYTMPINPVHATLLNNGKILIVSGSGNVPSNTAFKAAILDLSAGTVTTQSVGWDMFCNGMVVLPDGRVYVAGGTQQYDPFFGSPKTSIFDSTTKTFTDQQNMADGRWYPTTTVLGDGRVMIFSGTNLSGSTNKGVEIFTVGTGLSSSHTAPWNPPLYPRLHLLPNGKIFYSGSTTSSSLFDPSSFTWTTGVATTNYGGTRTYGSSVLLPLTPANAYKPKVLILGGGNPATATTETIDLSAATPKWVTGPNMSAQRIEMNATLLPNGKVLAIGGSFNDEDLATAALNADLYDPNSNTISSAGTEAFARLYHSVSLLLPDGRVWVGGGNPSRGNYESHMEVYSPAYLFNSNGTLATRPTITSVSTLVVGYGNTFTVQTPDAANISTAVLMRNGSVTHAFDMDQRYVGVAFTTASGQLSVTAPPNGNTAPPGYYMLFLINNAGVPSVAKMIQLSTAAGDASPVGTITAPTSNPVTIATGQTVSYAGSGTDSDGTISSYFWNFDGGTPKTSTSANPGSVTYSTSGTYTTTFTVTDNKGIADPHPPTRTINVTGAADFSVGVSPSLQSVAQGGTLPYTATITALNGFAGNVSLTVSGLPTGTTGTFNPTTIAGGGSSTLTVTTSGSTPTGVYTLTVTATSGTLTHTGTTALIVSQSGGTTVIGFGSGFSGGAGLQFNGHTTLNESRLQLTDTTTTSEASSAFWTTPVSVQNFNNVFEFQLLNPNADGFTFTLQNAGVTGLGSPGGGLGYGKFSPGTASILKSVAVKFDLYSNSGEGTNSTGLYINGATPTTPATTMTGGINIHNGNIFLVQMSYDGTTLTMTITDTVTPANTFTTSWPINIPTTVGGNTAFVGFTAGTGGQTATQDILAWTYGISGTPDFSLGMSPTAQSVVQGGNTTYTATVTASGGFTGSVALSATGLPTGATATFAPPSITNSGSSTMTVTTGASTPTGTYPLTVTATSGSITHTAGTSLIVTQSGGAATVDFGSGFTATGMQFNGHAKLNGTRLQLTDTTSTNQAASAFWTAPVNVQSFTNNFTFQLTNPNADGFTFTIQNSAVTALGSTGGGLGYGKIGTLTALIPKSVAVKFDLFSNSGEGTNSTGLYTNGASPTVPATTFSGGINLHSGDVFQVQMTYDGTTLTMTITDTAVPADTFTTSFPINIPTTVGGNTAFVGFTGGTGGQTATQEILNWTYNAGTPTPDFSLAVSPTSQSVVQGASTPYTATITPSNSFAGVVSFSVSGLPTGATAAFSPTTVTGTGSSTMTVSTVATTPVGTYPLTVTATSGTLTHTFGTSLTVTASAPAPDFSLAVSPSSQSVVQGASTPYTATITPANSFAGVVSFSVGGLPTGATAAFSPTTVTGTGSSTMTVSTVATTPVGTYPLTVTATSGTLTHTFGTSLTVTSAPVPDFSLSVSPGMQSVVQGASTPYTATIAPANGFTGVVSFSVSGLPTGATVAFNPTTVTATGSSAMTVSTVATTPVGTYPLTVTATSGTLTHTFGTSLTVTQSSGGTATVNFGSGFSASGLQFNGHTKLNGTRLQLTDTTSTNQAASAFWTTPVNVQTFSNTFTFQLTNPNADGFTFTIQNSAVTALGSTGAGLGYGKFSTLTALIPKSVAVKLDLFSNSGEGINSTGIYTNGNSPTTPATTLGGGVNLHSGDTFQVQMNYDGTTLTMTISDLTVPANTFTTSFPINIPGTVGANTAFVGFTGGTGGQTATQEILNWTYNAGTGTTPDFSITASPSTQSVVQGANTSYTATVTALNGFAGSVLLSASGLPTGASATFNPTSVTNSGPSTMTVTAGAATPVGSYTVTITGTSGSLTHSTTVTLGVTASGGSATIDFGSGFTATGLQSNGHTRLNGTRLQLTDTTTTQEAASAYWATAVNVQSFTTNFSFQVTNPNADGFTFVIQNAGLTALGSPGGGLGYGPYTPNTAAIGTSVAVKFDLFDNDGEGANSTGLYTNGATPNLPSTPLGGGVNLLSGDIFNVQMHYDGTTLTMTITDASVPADTFTTSFPINIPGTVGGNTAFVGFTGGTGGLTATQEILSWTYTTP